MSDTKWADVAHYYAFSGVMGELDWGPNSERIPLGSPQISELTIGRVSPIREGEIVFAPILRHRDDITEAEARELSIIHLDDDFDMPENESCLDSLNFDLAGGRLQKGNTVLSMWIGQPSAWHWLISRGFDMFDLIESGQAIRKEAGNG